MTFKARNKRRRGMELDKLEEDPPLSGAYIRSLVKQLTTMNTKHQGCVVHKSVSSSCRSSRKHATTQQHKKQVRRRLHTSRVYQERLLNMAEARKEIVTALKFHRATMKQATQNKQQQQQQQQHQQQNALLSLGPFHHQSLEQDGRLKYCRNPRIYPSCTTKFSTCKDENDFPCSSFTHPLIPPPPNYYTLSVVSPNIAPPSPAFVVENPSFTLPNHTMGLNLNLHDFNNLDPTLFLKNSNNNNSSFCYYSPPTSFEGGVSSSVVDTLESSATTQVNGGGLHAAIDDEGMAKMRSLGEQYQMEWNDTMNLVTSAKWSNFLNKMEHGGVEDEAYHHIFDELMEFPAWLNANDSCLEQWSEDYFKDLSLPW
ncbi:hypothetical protein Lal_00003110 [Lupinus albus]|uniref:Putative WD40/YVTN repeat-like-containing domain-containing protein n=1 Tax=Lupinus albus TaxID=3870 RepID=A0A6A4NDH7_LUPAL|nr:putative WD40/YVTN repeat-like-containing domain-containing protein [Lupinus albus]KAF1882928.1 hypothetical protein Lal_00003110 [Lupinus albus]